MRGKIVSTCLMAKSNFLSYKTLIYKHIECKKYKIQNRSQQKSHACVPLTLVDVMHHLETKNFGLSFPQPRQPPLSLSLGKAFACARRKERLGERNER